jgi:uncharacterized protein YraI
MGLSTVIRRIIFVTGLILLLSTVWTVGAQGNLPYGTAQFGVISAEVPSATYNFTGNTNDLVTIEAISLTAGMAPTLTVLGPSGAPVASGDGSVGRGQDASLTVLLPETGLYLVIVGRTATSVPQGDFVIRVDGVALNPTPLTASTTALLDTTTPVQGYLVTGSSVNVSGVAPGLNYRVELVGAGGVTLAQANGGGLSGVTFNLPDPAATYTLVLSTTEPGPINVAVTPDGAAAPAPVTTNPSTTTGACSVVAGGNGLNVRTGPSTEYAVITTLPNGSTATVLGAYAGWYEVSLPGGVRGWAASSVVTTTGDCSAIPAAVPPAAPPPTTAPVVAATATTTGPTPTYTPTTTGPTPTYTPTTEAPIQPEVTEEVNDTGTGTTQIADDSMGDPRSMRINRGESTQVRGQVSAPEGDRIDRVQVTAETGANVTLRINCIEGGNARFAISQGGQSVAYSCGQTYEFTANVPANATANIQIEALSGYTDWTILGQGF